MEQRKKEKKEKELQLKKLRKQLEEDKKKRFEKEKKNENIEENKTATNNEKKIESKEVPEKKIEIKPKTEKIIIEKEKNEIPQNCLLQIRMVDGKILKNEFLSTDDLFTVSNYIMKNSKLKNGEFTINIFPKIQYTVDEFKLTLKEAGLCPKGSIIIQNSDSQGKIQKGEGSFNEKDKDDNINILPYPGTKKKKNDSDSDKDSSDKDSDSDDDKKVVDKNKNKKIDIKEEENTETFNTFVSGNWYLSTSECPEDSEIKVFRKKEFFEEEINSDYYSFSKDKKFIFYEKGKNLKFNGTFSILDNDSVLCLKFNGKEENFDISTITDEILILST
jgi:hypothetical protein